MIDKLKQKIIRGSDISLSDIPFVTDEEYYKIHQNKSHETNFDFIQPENESRLLLLALLTKRVELLKQLIIKHKIKHSVFYPSEIKFNSTDGDILDNKNQDYYDYTSFTIYEE